MQVIKSNSAFDGPREKLHSYFSRGDIRFTADFHICFVCGAAADTVPPSGERSLRYLFMAHVEKARDSKLLCVRAETAATELLRQLEERKGNNIASFEKVIADTVDSVLIFPESPGSFAELGFFSAHDSIASKTLVAVRVEHQVNSFITLGPIHNIAKVSEFPPVPFVIPDNPEAHMGQIVERLLGDSTKTRPYRRRFERLLWKDYDGRKQLAILDEMVDIAGALTENDLFHLVNANFGSYDVSRIRLLLSLLVATGRICRNDDGDIFAAKRNRGFMECAAGDRVAVIAKWSAAYEEHFPEVMRELAGFRR